MRFFCAILTIALLLEDSRHCSSQVFMDLNFESASLSGLSEGSLPTTSAFPDWSAYYGPPGNPTQANVSTVYYDTTTLGGALVILVDSNNPSYGGLAPLQGNYSLLLEGSTPAAASTASLGQTGTIPNTALSLVLWEYGNSPDVSFNGQMLSFVDVSNALSYTVYAADISAYAGDTGQLLFTAPVNTYNLIDNIQFSTSAVPEPSALALSVVGSLFLAWRRWKKLS